MASNAPIEDKTKPDTLFQFGSFVNTLLAVYNITQDTTASREELLSVDESILANCVKQALLTYEKDTQTFDFMIDKGIGDCIPRSLHYLRQEVLSKQKPIDLLSYDEAFINSLNDVQKERIERFEQGLQILYEMKHHNLDSSKFKLVKATDPFGADHYAVIQHVREYGCTIVDLPLSIVVYVPKNQLVVHKPVNTTSTNVYHLFITESEKKLIMYTEVRNESKSHNAVCVYRLDNAVDFKQHDNYNKLCQSSMNEIKKFDKLRHGGWSLESAVKQQDTKWKNNAPEYLSDFGLDSKKDADIMLKIFGKVKAVFERISSSE